MVMDNAGARWFLTALCPVAMVIGIGNLDRSLHGLDAPTIGVFMLVIAVVVMGGLVSFRARVGGGNTTR